MLKACKCSNAGCSACDTPKKVDQVQATTPATPKVKFVDFEKLLVTEDETQLKDILKKDIRPS